MRKTALFVLTALIIGCFGGFTVGASSTPVDEQTANIQEAQMSYHAYIEKYEKAQTQNKDFSLSPLSKDEQNVKELNGQLCYVIEEGNTLRLEVVAENEGLFEIGFNYIALEGRGVPLSLDVYINGQVPYTEAKEISLPRFYYESGKITQDSSGNDIRPSQEEYKEWTPYMFKAKTGYISSDLKFYLQKGTNEISFTMLEESIAIKEIIFKAQKKIKSYDEKLGEWQAQGLKKIENKNIRIEAENTLYKSDYTIYPIYDRSSKYTYPSDAFKLRLNSIGGERWKYIGQRIAYSVTVEEEGLYPIALRWRQNISGGRSSERAVYINDEIQFSQANSIKFNYGSNWNRTYLGNNEEIYYFYLKKGENTISFEVVLGEMADILYQVNESILRLNEAYRGILLITGPNPDEYRDYDLQLEIPEIIEQLKKEEAILRGLKEKIVEYTGSGGSFVSQIDQIIISLSGANKSPQEIPRRFVDLKNSISGLGSWLLSAKEQPLELDCIVISPEESYVGKKEGNFFESLAFSLQKFLATFVTDYSVKNSAEGLNAWIVTGRDQAQIISQLAENYYNNTAKTKVNISLVPAGALLPATLAGKGPDVALSVASTEPINYGLRGAVVDLSQFDGFEEVAKRFNDSSFASASYQSKVYGLPETQTYQMLFLRTDIMNEMGITKVDTWEDIYSLMPELQKRYMEFGIPADVNSFAMLLYQKGGSIFNEKGTKCIMNSNAGIEALKIWSEFYTIYGHPITYDFANRFRTGEMPIAIADFSMYNTLSVFAPEIDGLWTMQPVPASVNASQKDRSVSSVGSYCMIMEKSTKKEASWDFISWWTQNDTQKIYGKELEAIMGSAARYPTANLEAFNGMAWEKHILDSINEQRKSVKGIPEIPGSYMFQREVNFMLRSVVYKGIDERETILDYTDSINSEIARKCKEFGITQ